MKLTWCTRELNPCILLHKSKWCGLLDRGIRMFKLNVLCLEQCGSSVSFLYRLPCSEKNKQRHTTCAITIFGLQGSYLFAEFDMFQPTWGAVRYGKTIRLKCIYLFCGERSKQRTAKGKKKEGFFKGHNFKFCPCML